jgi:DNA-binding MarR family transcriptional regulator
MARSLDEQTRAFQSVMVGLLKLYQFRDRNETVAYGLSVSQAYALRALSERGPLSMGELAFELNLTLSSTTRVVDPLVERKLVKRRQSASDRRVWEVSLGAAGRRLWSRIEGQLLAIDAKVLRQIPSAQREAVIETVRALAEATREWRAERVADPGEKA